VSRYSSSRFLALLALLALAHLGPTRADAQAPAGVSRHLHGILEDSASGRPLHGAEVLVFGRVQQRARTDDAGRFDFHNLPAEPVVVRVRLLGYAPLERPVDLSTGDAFLHLELGRTAVTLATIAVSADAPADPLARVAATTTLDAEALAQSRGQTLGETLKYLPGVAALQVGPAVSKPVIRGLNSQRVLVVNGGVRQEDQQWGTEHAPNIDTFDADQVTVVRGAGAVLYGPDALGGVVRIDPAEIPESGGFRGDVALNAFSNSRQVAASVGVQDGSVHLPVLGRVGVRARATGRIAGNGATPDYFLSNTGFRERNGSVALGMHRGWGHADVQVSHFSTELGVLRQAHVGNFDDLQRSMMTAPRDSAFAYAIGRPNQRVSHTSVRSRADVSLGGGGTLEVVYGLQANHRREYDNHGPLRFRDEAAFNLKLFTNSLDIRWHHGLRGRFVGTVGASGFFQGNQTLGKAFLIPGYDLAQGAVYAQEEWSIGPVAMSAGLRGDVFSQTTLAFADAGIRSPAGTKRWAGLSGSFGGEVPLGAGWTVALRAARSWRPPTVNERYAQGVHHGTAQFELGTPTLDAERGTTGEVTLRYGGASASLEVSTYRNQIDGFIYLEPRAPVQTIRGAFPAFTYSATRARLAGVELGGEWSPIRALQLQATGSLVRGTDRVRGGPLYDMPADRLSLRARWLGSSSRLGNWHAGVGGVLVRRQDGVPQSIIYALPTAGYALLNLELGAASVPLGSRRADVTLSVQNALDTRYRDYLSRYRLFVDDAGRDVVLRLRVPF
jgi:iron complex outermembrane receptor protein